MKKLFNRLFGIKHQPKSYDSIRIDDLEKEIGRLNGVIIQLMRQLRYREFGGVVMTEFEAKRFENKGIYPNNNGIY